jgi:hypothetical protein
MAGRGGVPGHTHAAPAGSARCSPRWICQGRELSKPAPWDSSPAASPAARGGKVSALHRPNRATAQPRNRARASQQRKRRSHHESSVVAHCRLPRGACLARVLPVASASAGISERYQSGMRALFVRGLIGRGSSGDTTARHRLRDGTGRSIPPECVSPSPAGTPRRTMLSASAGL